MTQVLDHTLSVLQAFPRDTLAFYALPNFLTRFHTPASNLSQITHVPGNLLCPTDGMNDSSGQTHQPP